jgi:hypothetical protein
MEKINTDEEWDKIQSSAVKTTISDYLKGSSLMREIFTPKKEKKPSVVQRILSRGW